MSLKVTLVCAGIAGKGFNSLGQGMDSGWISHGLAILSACAKAKGFEVNLLDLRALRDWDHVRSELELRQPDVVGVSMMSVDYNPAMECLAVVREVLPHAITVVGGAHPTIMPDEVKDSTLIDHVFLGEAEITFPDFLERCQRGEPSERVISPVQPDLDAIPFADHELFLQEWRKWGYQQDSPEAPFVAELPPPAQPWGWPCLTRWNRSGTLPPFDRPLGRRRGCVVDACHLFLARIDPGFGGHRRARLCA